MARISEVKIPIKFVVILAIIIIIFTSIYYCQSQSIKESLTFFSISCAAGAAILAAFYTGKTLNLLILESEQSSLRYENQREFLKKDRAMRFGERWNHPNMFHAREVCRKVFELGTQDETALKETIEASKTNIIHILNFFEELAIAIENDTTDIEITKNQFGGIMVSAWNTLENWINQYRSFRKRPKMWEVLEKLVHELEGEEK